jgi:hypothetical protein
MLDFAKAVTNLFGISHRRPKRQGITIYSHGLSIDYCKISSRHVEHEFTAKKWLQVIIWYVINAVSDPHFTNIVAAQIVAILAWWQF